MLKQSFKFYTESLPVYIFFSSNYAIYYRTNTYTTYNTYNNNITLTFTLTMYMFLALRILALLIPALVPIQILQYKKAS